MGIVVVCSTNITKYVELIPVYHNMTTHLWIWFILSAYPINVMHI
jgi:hypothetical protein